VGTVCIAVVVNGEKRVATFRFAGQREQVKFQSSQAALDMLRRLLDVGG
jgi:nicotinamide mononucleotide (NMN) deamidase PncC